MSWKEKAKKRAALKAVDCIEDGFVLGLGTGSTTMLAIKEIGRRLKEKKMQILGVPTSRQTYLLSIENGISITTLKKHPQLDLDIDGADQIDQNLNLIKGGGGALTREKIVATASRRLIIIADESKLTEKLGYNHFLPIEVLPFALTFVKSKIRQIGGSPVLREKKDGSGHFITDNGNFILDVNFNTINNPYNLESKLKKIPGIIESGLFLGMTETAFIGTKSTLKQLTARTLEG
jgi:ribose 5-phosphate isomerase A